MQTKIFASFETWGAVLAAAQEGKPLFYHAPMDTGPVRIAVLKIFKNRKLQIYACSLTFTVDAGHLSRFRYMVDRSPTMRETMDYLRQHGFMR